MSTDADRTAQAGLPAAWMPADYTTEEIAALIEAVLLVSPEPPTIEEIAAGTELAVDEIESGLAILEQQSDRGWLIQRHGRRLSLATNPRYADRVRMFLGLDREAKLSSASMEALALVAYQQPVTRAEVERIRGVDSSGVLATLHARGLIEPVARLATVGNPIQYGTTALFLSHFGLQSLDDLPPIGLINGKDGAEMLAAAQADATEPESTETSNEE